MFVLYWGWADIAQDSKKLGGMCSHRECGFTGREGKKAYFQNTSFMPDEISIILKTFYSVIRRLLGRLARTGLYRDDTTYKGESVGRRPCEIFRKACGGIGFLDWFGSKLFLRKIKPHGISLNDLTVRCSARLTCGKFHRRVALLTKPRRSANCLRS